VARLLLGGVALVGSGLHRGQEGFLVILRDDSGWVGGVDCRGIEARLNRGLVLLLLFHSGLRTADVLGVSLVFRVDVDHVLICLNKFRSLFIRFFHLGL